MTTPSGTFLSSQAQPGTFQPACLQGQRAHGWLESQALGQRPSKLPPTLPAGGRSKPRGFGSWGYSTCPQGPLVPSKSITVSPSLPGRPCPEASSLDSPRQQQGRPAYRRASRLCLCPRWPRDWRRTPGRGTGGPGASSEQSTPPVRLSAGASRDTDKLFWRDADPDSLKPTSSRATGNSAGQRPGPGAGREEPWGPGIPTPGLTGPAFRWKPRTARTPHCWEAALWSGQP